MGRLGEETKVWESIWLEWWYEMVVAYHSCRFIFTSQQYNHQTLHTHTHCKWECNLSRYQFYAKPQPFKFIESTEPNRIEQNRIKANSSYYIFDHVPIFSVSCFSFWGVAWIFFFFCFALYFNFSSLTWFQKCLWTRLGSMNKKGHDSYICIPYIYVYAKYLEYIETNTFQKNSYSVWILMHDVWCGKMCNRHRFINTFLSVCYCIEMQSISNKCCVACTTLFNANLSILLFHYFYHKINYLFSIPSY